MPNHEGVMQKIYELVSEGAGMALPGEIRAALHRRYHTWLGDKKNGMQTSPLDIWEAKEGLAIQERLREVGRELKENHADLLLSQKEFDACCLKVESTSLCPHCPDPPPPVD